MGNFLVIIAPERESEKLFSDGLANAQRIKNLKPDSTCQTNWVKAATFPRLNASASPPALDPQTGCWLLSVGTWFHTQGYSAGAESRLLTRVIEIGAEGAARELEGFFVIVFGDAREREVVVITDLIGSRHCFSRSFGEITALSTSSLLLASLGKRSVDVVSCEEFLRTGVIYENRTFFRDVKKIAPAQIARFRVERSPKTVTYWNVSQLDPDRFEGKRAVRELSEKLVGAAEKVGKHFSNPVSDLTGGYDSRAIAAAFLAAGVSFETTVAGPQGSADVIISKGLSGLTGIPHWHLENDARISHDQLVQALRLTDGEYDLVDYARIFSLHQRLSSRFDASINGSFGELARGYWWELLRPRIGKREPIDAKRVATRRYLVDPISPRLFPPGSEVEFAGHFAQVIDKANAGIAGWPNTAQMDNTYLELRMQHWQGRIASSTDQVWPCLSPFMLRPVLETMLQIKARWRYRSLIVRMMLAELWPELAAYPLEHGYPPLPLTWKTWPRYLPALKTIAGRLREKTSGPPKIESPRIHLQDEPEIMDLLDPQTMRLSEVVEVDHLRSFLGSSRDPNFAFNPQWNRMLSLEMALRV